MPYSVQRRDWIFVKGCGYLSFAKNMGKNITKTLSGKYFLIVLKNLPKKSDLVVNKIVDRITKVSKNSQENNSEMIKMSMIKKYLKKYIFQKKDKKLLIILILIWKYNNGILKNNKFLNQDK